MSYTIGSGSLWRRPVELRAVDGVSLTVRHGEVLALVGESGCGKTSLAKTVSGLLTPRTGSVLLDGQDVTGFPGALGTRNRAAVQMVFQDPYDSLNPRKTVYATLEQPSRIHSIVPAREIRAEVGRLLELVGLPQSAMDRFPHEFSGGQCQRIGVARAIAPRPRLLVADEAVSALDISIRAQLLSLLARLKRNLGLAMLFITHDLTVVRSFADRVAVTYLGRLVEEGPSERVFDAPSHPYTRAARGAFAGVRAEGQDRGWWRHFLDGGDDATGGCLHIQPGRLRRARGAGNAQGQRRPVSHGGGGNCAAPGGRRVGPGGWRWRRANSLVRRHPGGIQRGSGGTALQHRRAHARAAAYPEVLNEVK